MNIWSHVEVSQRVNPEGRFIYSIIVNDNVITQVINDQPRKFRNVKVYTSDNFYPASKARIDKLQITTKRTPTLYGMYYDEESSGEEVYFNGFDAFNGNFQYPFWINNIWKKLRKNYILYLLDVLVFDLCIKMFGPQTDKPYRQVPKKSFLEKILRKDS